MRRALAFSTQTGRSSAGARPRSHFSPLPVPNAFPRWEMRRGVSGSASLSQMGLRPPQPSSSPSFSSASSVDGFTPAPLPGGPAPSQPTPPILQDLLHPVGQGSGGAGSGGAGAGGGFSRFVSSLVSLLTQLAPFMLVYGFYNNERMKEAADESYVHPMLSKRLSIPGKVPTYWQSLGFDFGVAEGHKKAIEASKKQLEPAGMRRLLKLEDGSVIDCFVAGVGSPTVVINAGSVSLGAELQRHIARFCRCVVYSHAGMTVASGIDAKTAEKAGVDLKSLPSNLLTPGATDHVSVRGAADSESESKELATVLRLLDVDDDVIVVGLHYNWLSTLKFAKRNAAGVAGVVLLDPMIPIPEASPPPNYPRLLYAAYQPDAGPLDQLVGTFIREDLATPPELFRHPLFAEQVGTERLFRDALFWHPHYKHLSVADLVRQLPGQRFGPHPVPFFNTESVSRRSPRVEYLHQQILALKMEDYHVKSRRFREAFPGATVTEDGGNQWRGSFVPNAAAAVIMPQGHPPMPHETVQKAIAEAAAESRAVVAQAAAATLPPRSSATTASSASSVSSSSPSPSSAAAASAPGSPSSSAMSSGSAPFKFSRYESLHKDVGPLPEFCKAWFQTRDPSADWLRTQDHIAGLHFLVASELSARHIPVPIEVLITTQTDADLNEPLMRTGVGGLLTVTTSPTKPVATLRTLLRMHSAASAHFWGSLFRHIYLVHRAPPPGDVIEPSMKEVADHVELLAKSHRKKVQGSWHGATSV